MRQENGVSAVFDGGMLKHRLILGTLMTALFTGLVLLDAWLDGSLQGSCVDSAKLQAGLLYAFMALLLIGCQLELSRLASAAGAIVYAVPAAAVSVLLAGGWYWGRLAGISPQVWISGVMVAAAPLMLIWQYCHRGTSGVFSNCGACMLSVVYLGLFGSFVLAIRIEFGVWAFLMFIFTVKTADIGAYTAGMLFGRHKFSPVVSPGKTWEGMAGAVAGGALCAVGFAAGSGIMAVAPAAAFGAVFAVVGQAGDLAESMMKRDAVQKDSSRGIPGFGGVLDVIDSPLAAAPFAYLFFALAC